MLGYTLTHTQAHCATSTKSGRRSQAGVDAAHNIVLHYDRPEIRSSTQRILGDMLHEGARFVRTILWFRDTTNDTRPSPADVLGLIPVRNGSAPSSVLANLLSYVRDVRNAGYSRIVLVPGPLIEASPKCRAVQFGACFDRSTLPRSWAFIAQVKRAVQPLAGTGFRIILDIGPETCPIRSAQPIGTTLAEYTAYMLRHYAQVFHDRDFIVSCGGGASAAQALAGLSAVTALYRHFAAKPAGLDVHMYFRDRADYVAALTGAEAAAESLGVDLFVLETYQRNSVMFRTLRQLRDSGRMDDFRMLGIWPLTSSAGCQISETAPYPLQQALEALQ